MLLLNEIKVAKNGIINEKLTPTKGIQNILLMKTIMKLEV